MSAPRIVRCSDSDAVAAQIAEALAATITAARAARGAAHVALSGGSSVAAAYELLGPLVGDWDGVHLWYGDERVVPHDDAESTHLLATTHLAAPGAAWHPVATALGLERAAAAYARELGDTVLDVALNGMGPDGHTASLFPGFPQVGAEGICLAVPDSPKPPPERVTLTLGVFAAAGQIVLHVAGADKAPMLARVLAGPDPAVPASLLARERLLVVADAAALGDG